MFAGYIKTVKVTGFDAEFGFLASAVADEDHFSLKSWNEWC